MRSARRLRLLVVGGGEPWPLNSGGRLHLYHVLRELAPRADVTLALTERPHHADRLPPGVRLEVVPPTPNDAGPAPMNWVGRLIERHAGRQRHLSAWLDRHARPERFDVAMLHTPILGQHAPFCHVPLVWNAQDELVLPTLRDAEFSGWRTWPETLRRATLYALLEHWVARQARATIYVSTVDASYARRWVGGARLEVVQNGVDFDYFAPFETPGTPNTIVFVGSLEFVPNVDGITWFVRHVWPDLQAGETRRRLVIVGRRPVDEVRALAILPGVELHADVPDVRPYLEQAGVLIVPTRKGGGLKNKILEGCAVRRPVVASLRALGGLSAQPGIDVLAAHRPANWITILDRLLREPQWAAEVADRGHAWVRQAHSWARTGGRFFEIVARAAGYELAPAHVAPVQKRPRSDANVEVVAEWA